MGNTIVQNNNMMIQNMLLADSKVSGEVPFWVECIIMGSVGLTVAIVLFMIYGMIKDWLR